MTLLEQQQESSSGFASASTKVVQPNIQKAQDKAIEVLCRGKTQLFFSERTKDMQSAQAICMACPGQQECLSQARANPPYAGVWGGVIFVDGEELLFKRGRGRPAKQVYDKNHTQALALSIKQIA
jgi:hypothetical protein